MQSSQDALAQLKDWRLIRDDSGPRRVYRDRAGTVYHSVTSILSATQDSSGLEQWAAKMERLYGPGAAIQERDVAAERGTQAHNSAEYLLKTAQRLARSTANRRNSFRWDPQGLAHIPPRITQWALGHTHSHVPAVSWSASGYARGLTSWITENVTGIHASEFSIHHPAGFAGTADALLEVSGVKGLVLCDFKTSTRRKQLHEGHSYVHQLGAYSLGLEHLTGLRCSAGLVILARRCGPPQTHLITEDELVRAQDAYLKRVEQFYAALEAA